MTKTILLTLLLFTGLSSGASLMRMSALPLQWQVVELEKIIRGKVEKKLGAKVADEKYVVDVKIDTAIPSKPNFKQTPESPPEEVKYTDEPKTASNGDYIVFSKFGMEAPVVSKMKKQKPPEKSEFEYLWKYQESQSVYNNLLAVKIDLKLNKDIPSDSRPALEAFIQKTDLNIGELEPEYAFNYIDFTPLSAKNKPTNKSKTAATSAEEKIKQALEHFATPISLVLAAIIFVIGALLLFKKYESLKKSQMAQKQMHDGQIRLDGKNESEDKDDAALGQGLPGQSAEEEKENGHISGLKRFKDVWEEDRDTAMVLLKDWIKRDSEESKIALVYLLDKLDGEKLKEIFSRLTLGERQIWKGHINDAQLGPAGEAKADDFVSKEIISSFIVPDAVSDMDLRKQILGLNENNACQFIKDNPELAPALVNVAPSSILSKLIGKLEPALSSKYLMEASKLGQKELAASLELLKSKLSAYVLDETVNPFIEKLASLAAFCSFQEEQTIFDALIENGQQIKARKLAMERFPSFLADRLGPESLKTVMTSFPMAERSFIIESFDGDFKRALVDCFAPEGSSAREMLELELEQFSINLGAKRELEEGREDFMGRFYEQVKETVRKDDQAKNEAEKIVSSWLWPEETGDAVSA